MLDSVNSDKGFVEWNVSWYQNHPWRALLQMGFIIISGGAVIPIILLLNLYLWVNGQELLLE